MSEDGRPVPDHAVKATTDDWTIQDANNPNASEREIKAQLRETAFYYLVGRAADNMKDVRVKWDANDKVWMAWAGDPVAPGDFVELDDAKDEALRVSRESGVQHTYQYSARGDWEVVRVTGVPLQGYKTEAQAESQKQAGQIVIELPDGSFDLRREYTAERLSGYHNEEDAKAALPDAENFETFRYPDNSWGTREKFVKDPAIDPKNPFFKDEQDAPITVDLGGGRRMYFLTDGSTIVKQGPVDWKDAEKVTIGGEDFIVWPDGTKSPVGDKFLGGVAPGDIQLEDEIELKDGTFAAVFNNGQIFRTGKEQKPAEIMYQGQELTGIPGRFQVTQPNGQVEFIEPIYDPGLVQMGDYNLFEQRSGTFTDLGLPEVPAQIETLTGAGGDQQQFIRGTQGELVPLNDVLDRVIEMAVLEGTDESIKRAIAFDDFRKRPTRTEALEMALEFARSPADQVLISAISSGETHIAPPSPGELQRVGPQADFLVEAYEEFRATLSGGSLPTPGEFAAAMAPEPEPEAVPEPISEIDRLKAQGITLDNQIKTQTLNNLQIAGEDSHQVAVNKISATKGTDEGLTEFMASLGLSSGKNLTQGTTDTLARILSGLPDSQKDYGSSQVESIYRGELTADQVIANLAPRVDPEILNNLDLGISDSGVEFTDPKETPAAGATGTYEENWAKSLAAYPDLTDKTFDLFGGVDLSQKTADQINVHAGAPAGQSFGASTVRSNIHTYRDPITKEVIGSETFSKEFGWESPGAIRDRQDREAVEAYKEEQSEFADKMRSKGYNPDGSPLSSASAGDSANNVTNTSASSLGSSDSVPTSFSTGSPAITNNTLAYTADTSALTNNALGATGSDMSSGTTLGTATNMSDFEALIAAASAKQKSRVDPASPDPFGGGKGPMFGRAGGGIVQPGEMTVVGESGPELALLPNGTEIIPLDRNVQPDQARRLRRRGIPGMAEGGIVFDRYGGELPSGVRRTVAGQSVDPSAGRLFRAAGLGVPSGQGLRNMLPEDLEIYQDLGAQAGIPEGSFQRELALGIPSGERQRGSARFLPLSLRS